LDKYGRRTLTLLLALCVGLALAAPAVWAKPDKPSKPKKGKQAVGEVVSFDEAARTLVVTLRSGKSFTGTVAENVQVKVEHRGKPATKGNPTKGSVTDLVAGAKVLKIKVKDGEVTKLRLRLVGSEVVDAPGGEPEPSDSDEEEAEDEEAEVGDPEELLDVVPVP
jgi:hypothetical protein